MANWLIEIPEREKIKIQSAWTVLNTQGGGRMEALNTLYKNKVDLRGLYCESGYFGGIDLHGADLSWANLTNANFDGANLEGVNLQGAKLDGASFMNANLKNASLKLANLLNTNFYCTNLFGVTLQEAKLRGTNFINANLQNANFDKASSTYTLFNGADLTNTDFRNIHFDGGGINLVYKSLYSAKNIDKALFNAETKKEMTDRMSEIKNTTY